MDAGADFTKSQFAAFRLVDSTAAELAECGFLGIYPVIGWWRERPQLERWSRSVRYSVIVSLKTASTEVDLYTPVANQLAIPIEASF